MPKTAKLFKNGRSQAVRLPMEFRFEGTEVQIERDPVTGNVVLSPPRAAASKESWSELFARIRENPAEEDFLADRGDQLPPPPIEFE